MHIIIQFKEKRGNLNPSNSNCQKKERLFSSLLIPSLRPTRATLRHERGIIKGLLTAGRSPDTITAVPMMVQKRLLIISSANTFLR